MKVGLILHQASLPICKSKTERWVVIFVLTMYSQKSEFGKVMIAWKEYGPDPWGITGMS